MTDNRLLSNIRFSKDNRAFHNLPKELRRKVLELIQGGVEIGKAIRKVKARKQINKDLT